MQLSTATMYHCNGFFERGSQTRVPIITSFICDLEQCWCRKTVPVGVTQPLTGARVRAWHVYLPVRELCVPREEISVQIRITAVPFPLCSSAPTKHNAIRTLRNSESVLKEYIYLCLVCENLRASAPFPQRLRHPTQTTSRLVPHVKLVLSVCGANLDEY